MVAPVAWCFIAAHICVQSHEEKMLWHKQKSHNSSDRALCLYPFTGRQWRIRAHPLPPSLILHPPPHASQSWQGWEGLLSRCFPLQAAKFMPEYVICGILVDAGGAASLLQIRFCIAFHFTAVWLSFLVSLCCCHHSYRFLPLFN